MLAAILSLMLLPSFNPAVLSVALTQATEVEEVVLHPALVPICTCESGQGTGKPQQYDLETGKVLRGKINPKDIGMCQINEYWNGKAAVKLGYDIYSEEGNIKMANYLYETRGTQDWGWSKECWKSAP